MQKLHHTTVFTHHHWLQGRADVPKMHTFEAYEWK